MSTEWIPNYIHRTIDYRPNDILTAQEYNAILNLLITQGDYNSSWLDYLQNDAIPDAISEISAEAIAEAISVSVREEIDALASAVKNKTSLQLNSPAITILNIGQEYTGIAALKELLDIKNLFATYAVAVNLVGNNPAYPTIAQLTSLKNSGNTIVAYGTDGTALTSENADTIAETCKTFMNINGFDEDIFIYPSGSSDADVVSAVHNFFKYAANKYYEGVLLPENYPETIGYTSLCNLPIVEWDNTITFSDIKDVIDTLVENNHYMILQINTDAATYDSPSFSEVLDYILTKSFIEYPETISDEMNTIYRTIGNSLAVLRGIYVTTVNNKKVLSW